MPDKGSATGKKSGGKPASAVTFDCSVYKVQTLVDGGLRITLDLPETAIAAAAKLMEYKRREVPLRVSTLEIFTKFDNETQKEAKGGAARMDSRRIRNR